MFHLTVTRLLILLSMALLAASATAAPAEPTVTLDVKDADVREILRSLKEQCGIVNLLVDKDVQGKGSLYIREVPCENAFRVVFKQFSLSGTVEPNLVHVERRDQ